MIQLLLRYRRGAIAGSPTFMAKTVANWLGDVHKTEVNWEAREVAEVNVGFPTYLLEIEFIDEGDGVVIANFLRSEVQKIVQGMILLDTKETIAIIAKQMKGIVGQPVEGTYEP